jgi:hypothetical protein
MFAHFIPKTPDIQRKTAAGKFHREFTVQLCSLFITYIREAVEME